MEGQDVVRHCPYCNILHVWLEILNSILYHSILMSLKSNSISECQAGDISLIHSTLSFFPDIVI